MTTITTLNQAVGAKTKFEPVITHGTIFCTTLRIEFTENGLKIESDADLFVDRDYFDPGKLEIVARYKHRNTK